MPPAYVLIRMKALLALLLATTALADEPTIASLAEANRYALTLDKSSISGPGADFLLQSAAGAQFVAIGEEHNVAEVAPEHAARTSKGWPAGSLRLRGQSERFLPEPSRRAGGR